MNNLRHAYKYTTSFTDCVAARGRSVHQTPSAGAETFSEFEKLELGKQLRWAAYSVPANIVQGFAERSKKARLNFLNIAEASLAEVGYWSFWGN
jgi:four helix bundle protein